MKKIVLFLLTTFCITHNRAQTLVPFYPITEASGAEFGTKLDLDGNEIIVSSKTTTFSQPSNGKVYLFEKNQNGIEQKQVFFPSDTQLTDAFGYSISIQNNFICIGSPLHDSNFQDSGTVYIYHKSANDYELNQILTAPDAVTNHHFGSCVKVFGDKLFISADNKVFGQSALTNYGAVYFYLYNGTEWIFQQKITDTYNRPHFGKKLDVNNSFLVAGSQNGTDEAISIYKFSNNSFTYASGYGYWSTGQIPFDYSLSGNTLYILYIGLIETILINENGTSAFYDPATFELLPDDQQYDRITSDGDNIFVGSNSYILQTERNFPVLHYKKVNNHWDYYTTYYGTGPVGHDDYFGSTIKSKGNLLVIGSPAEEEPFIFGKAYILDFTLDTANFDQQLSSIYPNPAHDYVTIRNNSMIGIVKTEIYSVTGHLLQTENKNPDTISLDQYAKGLYFMKLYYQNASEETFKIIKN